MFTPFKRLLLGLLIMGSAQYCVKANTKNTLSFDEQTALLQVLQDKERWDDCDSRLKLSALKAKKIDARCVNARTVNADSVNANTITVESNLCLPSLKADAICAQNVSTTNLCATGTVRVNNLINCTLYAGQAAFIATTTYTLGTNIEFDNIIDDPNNDFSVSPFFYTAPFSGYYIITLELDQNHVTSTSPNPILGVPTANPKILRNGLVAREAFFPFLSFVSLQRSNVTALIHLNAGDLVTAQYDILVVDEETGLTPITGTVEFPDGNLENKSTLVVHLLSVDCETIPGCQNPCGPCPQPTSCVPQIQTCITTVGCCPNFR